ncbi:hypothetical protein SLE2022_191060 [Rubroshorea leprosula]
MAKGDCESVISKLEVEENLIAAAEHIVRALGSSKNLTKDGRKILADLGTQLYSMATTDENMVEGEGLGDIEEQLNAVQEKIMNREADHSMIWESGSDDAFQYLIAADKAQKLTERLESLHLQSVKDKELLRRSHDVLQTAMGRLEEEFKHMLVENRQPLEHMSFRSSEDEVADESSVISFGDDSVDDSIHRDSISRTSEEFVIDLVHLDVIPDLRSIANLMFKANYDHECTQAYVIVRKDVLNECLYNLEMQKVSIEDVLKMEWASLNSKIKRWIWVMKIFVRVYLASEKSLSDQIFLELGSVKLSCFIEASKASMQQLLNFTEAILIGPRKPEKLSRILDMYEVLADLLPDIDALFPDEAGSRVRIECHDVLRRLGDSVKATFLEFKNAIASNTSTTPFAGGGIHHLTRYVMNYIPLLTDYSETLNLLLKDVDEVDSTSPLPDMSPAAEEESIGYSGSSSPMAIHFRSVTSILEANLHEKSKLYKDTSLQHFFLMNNMHYMAQKVKNSELRLIFGDKWIRKHNGKFQQHAMDYERATWSSILLLLKDDGNTTSGPISTNFLKEKFRSFYIAFEEVYKTQTAWLIPDVQLREDLRISTSLKVLQAYRTFVGRHNNHISEKHIKYNPDDLQNYLLDFFEGFQKSLPNSHRR